MAAEDPETPASNPGGSITVQLDEPRRRFPKHVQLDLSSRPDRPWGSGSSIHLRSYSQSPFRSSRSSGAVTPNSHWSPRTSVSTINLQHLLEKLELDQYDTYGVEELRDGFFDASFFRPLQTVKQETTPPLPTSIDPPRPFFSELVHNAVTGTAHFLWTVFRTYQGVNVAKSLLSYFVCYILCLVPVTQEWLGKYNYFATISVLLNHAGRTFGAQIDGLVLCVLGAAVGMGWGCLALELSNQAGPPKERREGIVELFLIIFAAGIAGLRSTMVRLYQALMSAGVAVFFMCLVEPGQPHWNRMKVREFAVPWLVGQAVCLAVNIIVMPGAGNREVAMALHNALLSALHGLLLPREHSPEIRRNLNMQLINLSEAFRDMRMELTFSRFCPKDIGHLRNTLQAIIRDLMAVDPTTTLFDPETSEENASTASEEDEEDHSHIIIDIDTPAYERPDPLAEAQTPPLKLVKEILAGRARDLIDVMSQSLAACDIALMDIAGHPQFPTKCQITCNESVEVVHARLKDTIAAFDEADVSLIDHPLLPRSYSKHPELVQLFLFVHPLRQTADSVEILAKKVMAMSAAPKARSMKFFLPSYPWKKALYRTGPQVRHDRGGLTANYYFRFKEELDRMLWNISSHTVVATTEAEKQPDYAALAMESTTARYKVWRVMHRLQGFEARFAIKLAAVTTFLSLPLWLNQSRWWYNENNIWWAVIAAWFMMHPRVGGNAQDLITRSVAATTGAVWGGLAYAAGSGNPYVMAVFALIYMFPAMFRLTTSTHPRSGLMACVTFSIVSLTVYNGYGFNSAAHVAWTRGVAIVVGICAAVVVNWCIWPFVARHALRKSISAMMFNLGIVYSGIVARYIYHDEGVDPTEEDISKSYMLDMKLREGFVRMRELLEMTTHEIRLRGPFKAAPYMALIDTLERFFEHLVQVRQASLYFQPYHLAGSEEQNRALLSFRRDAVASILMNLYTIGGALRVKKPIPRYLPSAAVARKHLLDQMEERELEEEEALEGEPRPKPERHKRWADVYQFAYSSALTDIVGQLEELQTLTKEICGEMALDVTDL
ncbi:hypothetical protein BDZ91DRAFT_711231 [Kalaharituber pfeilii]|nr:hypothetical protein BDZ91DRAFT_711231 [Kalaharituber pfeilii]